jgi:aryl carrier-like protein
MKVRLPEYMVPTAFVALEKLPLTPNGKVDRRALPEAEAGNLAVTTPYVEARTETEKSLVEIWTQLLKLERIGVDDNFFELGGDSILSIQVIARATQAGMTLTAQDIFEHQTIAALARAADAAVAA